MIKRCPQCLFLFPESDETCDFDKTLLEVVDDAEIDAATTNASRISRSRTRTLLVATTIGLLLGLIVFAVYYGVTQRTRNPASVAATSTIIESPSATTGTPLSPEPDLPSLSPSPSPSPSPPAPSKRTSKETSTSHTRATTDPISTSGPGIASRQGGKPVIILTSGAKIDADEVWRTRDGIWYRRNGMVTFLKRSQVKSILTSSGRARNS